MSMDAEPDNKMTDNSDTPKHEVKQRRGKHNSKHGFRFIMPPRHFDAGMNGISNVMNALMSDVMGDMGDSANTVNNGPGLIVISESSSLPVAQTIRPKDFLKNNFFDSFFSTLSPPRPSYVRTREFRPQADTSFEIPVELESGINKFSEPVYISFYIALGALSTFLFLGFLWCIAVSRKKRPLSSIKLPTVANSTPVPVVVL